MASNQPGETAQSTNQSSNNGGMLGGMTDKLSSAVGGGQSSPKDQSLLSQGIDAVQQSVFGQSEQSGSEGNKSSGLDQDKQDVHAAVDQAHPEMISEFMRDKYMSRTDEMNKEEART